MREYLHAELTSKIIKSFYNVYRRLGPGFLESIYQNAVAVDLENNGMGVEKEKLVEIFYNGAVVGNHRIENLARSARKVLHRVSRPSGAPQSCARSDCSAVTLEGGLPPSNNPRHFGIS